MRKNMLTRIVVTLLLSVGAFMEVRADYEIVKVDGNTYCIFPATHTATITSSAYHLGDMEFRDYKGYQVDEFVIPDSIEYEGEVYAVTAIGERAFSNSCLGRLVIPSTVKTIDPFAFGKCKMPRLDIPSTVTLLRFRAFANCLIDSVILPSRMGSLVIEEKLFWGDDPHTYVNYVRLPKDMTSIPSCMFKCTELADGVEIPETVTSIGDMAFDESNLSRITLPANLEELGIQAFGWCNNLKSITLPKGIKKIPSRLFSETRLDTLRLLSLTPPWAVSRASSDNLFYNYVSSYDEVWSNLPILIVPNGTREQYQSTIPWNNFQRIYEESEVVAINEIRSNDSTKTVYYSLDGRRLKSPQKGINIIRQSDGTTKKVIVK